MEGCLKFLLIILTCCQARADVDVRVYSKDDFKGDEFEVTGLNKVGDCAEFWSPSGGIDPDWARFNDRARSIKLPDGVCVRLYENDCDWVAKARTLDTTPDSPWVNSLAKKSFAGILSGVELIECPNPEPPVVTLYSAINFKGDAYEMRELRQVGDCQELWNPAGMGVMISDDARKFNDRAQSIKIADGFCARANADNCDAPVRILDIKPDDPWAKDLAIKVSFRNIISSVELIDCPQPSGITLYSATGWKGDKLELDDLSKVGDTIALWSPKGYVDPISDHLRVFNDRAQSIKLPPGYCVRLYENTDTSGGRTLDDTCSDSKWTKNLGIKQFGGIVSEIEVTEAAAPPPPPPLPVPAPVPPKIIYDPPPPPLIIYDPPVVKYEDGPKPVPYSY